MSRTGSPDTLYEYEAGSAGVPARTALDVNANGVIDYAGPDRITASSETYEKDASNGWWRVMSSSVWTETGSDACVTSSVKRVRMTGLGASAPVTLGLPSGAVLTAQTETIDWRGNVTRISTYTDAGSASVWTVTETPGSIQPAIQKSVAGYAVLMVSSTAVTNSYTNDGFARQTGVADGRGNTTVIAYNALGQVAYTEDAASNRTHYAYDANGRRSEITDPLTNTVFTAYDSLGNVTTQRGATYPVAYEYDTQGRKVSMKTFRDQSNDGDETRWLYDNVTGLLTNKVYADGSRVGYTYTSSGKLATRTWARGLTTDYSYDALGQLTSIAYSDTTPDIIFACDRMGNMVSVTDASGMRVFSHDIDGQTITDTLSAIGHDFVLLELRDAFGRETGYSFSNTVNGITSQIAGMSVSYDSFGHLSQVSVDGVSSLFRYCWLPGTDLQQSFAMPNGVTRENFYESCRDVPASVTHTNASGVILTKRIFTRDASGNLTGRTQYRFGDDTNRIDVFSQNARGEIATAELGTNAYAYSFDPIGNRLATDEPQFSAAYSANALNQYISISNYVTSSEFIPEFDEDGNQTLVRTSTGIWHVTYNAENRPIIFSNDTAVIEMAYDYQGRRFEYKEIVSATLTRHARYLYRGYLQIAALDLLDATNVIHTVAWDPTEPTATRPLVLQMGTNWWCYGFDQGKNVTELFDSSGNVVGAYDYTTFGDVLSATGAAAFLNPFTFSSEAFNYTIGLVQYNYRPYNPFDGRFIGCDPIYDAVQAGTELYPLCLYDSNEVELLYQFCLNDPINNIDLLGLGLICNCPYAGHILDPGDFIKTEDMGGVKCNCENSGRTVTKIESAQCQSYEFYGMDPFAKYCAARKCKLTVIWECKKHGTCYNWSMKSESVSSCRK